MSTVSKVSTFVRIILNPLLNSLTNVTFQLPDINQYLEMVVTWTLDQDVRERAEVFGI